MHTSPKILVVTDEPMLTVNLLSELEDRGFAVEPMRPGEHRNCSHSGIDAAIFDLHHPDEVSLMFASKLRRSAIPLVTLGGCVPSNSVRIAGARNFLSRPINYDSLAELLCELISQSQTIAPQNVVAFQRPEAMSAEER
ncbi:hypothetical protein [Hoeflea ulvae]|uniref:Response regulatory domain-containing protein n=1 Tax=Hoeflea ulvae TaxID=2983764 RepID=A0ABT3YD07_9HYPH|nr:hypothetical protein [Hoeflea ulvae]MCY0093769.1 hypothetical protein [Hoeflea ulvae]